MKRDIEYFRKIMLAIESSKTFISFENIKSLADSIGVKNDDYLRYQLELMISDNLVHVSEPTLGYGYADYEIYQLTSRGCDMLSAIRSDSDFASIKNFASKIGFSVTYGLVMKYIQSKLGI